MLRCCSFLRAYLLRCARVRIWARTQPCAHTHDTDTTRAHPRSVPFHQIVKHSVWHPTSGHMAHSVSSQFLSVSACESLRDARGVAAASSSKRRSHVGWVCLRRPCCPHVPPSAGGHHRITQVCLSLSNSGTAHAQQPDLLLGYQQSAETASCAFGPTSRSPIFSGARAAWE